MPSWVLRAATLPFRPGRWEPATAAHEVDWQEPVPLKRVFESASVFSLLIRGVVATVGRQTTRFSRCWLLCRRVVGSWP